MAVEPTMPDDLEHIRSIRRAALVGDRKEILATVGNRVFTIKDARDVLLKSDYIDHNEDREFYIRRSWLVHYAWRRYFADRPAPGRLRYNAKWVQKDQTGILMAADSKIPSLKRYVDHAVEAMIAKGLISLQPRQMGLREPRTTDGDAVYWLTKDGDLLATAAWSPPLTKEKADALIQGVLDRAVIIAQNPDEYLMKVTLLGVFGSYTDERVSTYNDVDVLYECQRSPKDLSDKKWDQLFREMAERDGRTHRSIIEFYAWPHTKVGQFLHSRKRQLRMTTAVSHAIRFKVLYQNGILEQPFFVDLPNGSHGPAWEALTNNT